MKLLNFVLVDAAVYIPFTIFASTGAAICGRFAHTLTERLLRMKKNVNLLREFSVPLIVGVVLAIGWANFDFPGYTRFLTTPLAGDLSFHFFANELFMALFFAVAAVEITQSCLPGGDLYPACRAVSPFLATLGGVIGPALVYLLLNALFGRPELQHGWGIPTATDIALAWLAARAIFGSAHPAISFLLLLAVLDDAIGMIIIALFYPDPHHPVEVHWLILVVAGMIAAFALRRFRISNYWPYLILGGGLSWAGLYLSHLHPALALVFIVPFLPHGLHETLHLFEEKPYTDNSPLARFELEWKAAVDVGLFFFGLANAGVEFSRVNTVTWLVLISLLAGKTVGIFAFGCLAEFLGFKLPAGIRKRELLIVGIVAGTGFTVALFVADAAFVDEAIVGAAKMGAMFSAAAMAVGVALGRVLGIWRCVR